MRVRTVFVYARVTKKNLWIPSEIKILSIFLNKKSKFPRIRHANQISDPSNGKFSVAKFSHEKRRKIRKFIERTGGILCLDSL